MKRITDRDYIKLSTDEERTFKKYQDESISGYTIKGTPIPKNLSIDDPDYTFFVYRHESLFPNNEISDYDLNKYEKIFGENLNEFKNLFSDEDTTESDILNFIRDSNSY